MAELNKGKLRVFPVTAALERGEIKRETDRGTGHFVYRVKEKWNGGQAMAELDKETFRVSSPTAALEKGRKEGKLTKAEVTLARTRVFCVCFEPLSV